MSSNKLLTLILIFCVPCFNSCQEEDKEPERYTYYLQDMLKPFMFKQGSYWVYQNDSTGVLDSVVVLSTQQDFFPMVYLPGQTTADQQEFFQINLHDYLDNSNFNNFLSFNWVSKNGSSTGGQPVLLVGYSIGYKYEGAEVTDSIDSLNIFNNVFTNVVKMKIIASEQHQNEFGHDTYLYFKDSIGLVKKEIDIGAGNMESWSLKRWNINL